MSSDCSGYVYVLSNSVMPGIVKIGRSKHGGRTRAIDLYKQGGTGVPMPFKMEFEMWWTDCVSLEAYVHEKFDKKRINESREFFSVTPFEAMQEIIKVSCEYMELECCNPDFCVTESAIGAYYNNRIMDHAKSLGAEGVIVFLDIAQSLQTCLTDDEVCSALTRYKAECIKRAEKLHKNNICNITEAG